MPLIHIKSKKLEFKFNINGKYTLLKGDSGIGKTTFYNLVSEMNGDGSRIGVQNLSKLQVIAVPKIFENFTFEKFSNCILVIDEHCTIFNRKDCVSLLKNSNNYFIIINRSVDFLPIHVESVFTLQCSNHFYTLKPLYTRFKNTEITNVDSIIVEDSNSGYSFVKDVFSAFDINKKVDISSSHGASSIVKTIEKKISLGYKHFVIFYDSAAFAGYIDLLFECMNKYTSCTFFIVDWDSFEHYLLASKYFNIKLGLEDLNCEFESLEQYATFVLCEKMRGYKKDTLSNCFKRSRCKKCSAGGCQYRHLNYYVLIYSRLAVVYSFFKRSFSMIKVDFSYNYFNSCNKEIVKKGYRIIDIVENTVTILNLSTNREKKIGIVELINNILQHKLSVTNPSLLKEWNGWSGAIN